jgi:tryptophan synthase alpha subunit
MKAYVVVDKRGEIVKDAGITFVKKYADIVRITGFGVKTGEQIKSFTIPKLK